MENILPVLGLIGIVAMIVQLLALFFGKGR